MPPKTLISNLESVLFLNKENLMSQYSLKPFTPPPTPFSIGADYQVTESQLEILFTLKGDIATLNLPKPVEFPKRVEGLYHHTCVEIFLKRGKQYLEWNFSFSGDWCIFLFEGYRKKSESKFPLDSTLFNLSHISQSSSEASIKALIPLNRLEFLEKVESQIGFSAVLEHPKSVLSYWALTHVGEKPDFHQEKSFIVKI
jgi:hypothetical protein